MTYELKILTKGRNYHGCYLIKGYRKDLQKCIKAAQNDIEEALCERKDIYEFRVNITSFGKKVYNWKYIPTFR